MSSTKILMDYVEKYLRGEIDFESLSAQYLARGTPGPAEDNFFLAKLGLACVQVEMKECSQEEFRGILEQLVPRLSKTTITDIFEERFPDQIARDVEQTTIASHPDITAFTLASVPRNCRCTVSCKTEILVLCREKIVIFIDSNNYDKIDVAVEILRRGGR